MSEETEFPKSVEGFGYQFNDKGELRNIQTGERFEFFVKPEDRDYNQRHYEELGEVIGDFIEDELVKNYNLIRKIIPVESEEDDNIAKSRIYLSDDAQECQTLLLLIQGSGVVRPGQWARQVIINDSLELGTMFPYIRKAQELKWGIVIFNPNENYGIISKDGRDREAYIPGSESPQRHCLYVWDKFVSNAKAEKILIVAHSYGGICTAYMLDRFADDFYKRVKGIALTDSVHSSGMIPTRSRQWFSKKALNWIKSSLSVDEPIPEANQFYGCRCFSAGHSKHEYTSGYAIESVFEYLKYLSKEKHNKDNGEITNQKNETSEQSSVANNDKVDKDSTVVESLNEETKPQTQNGCNSTTHEKGTTTTEDLQPNSMEIDELPNKASSEKDTKVPEEPQLDSSPAMEIDKTTIETSSENDIKVPEEPQLDSSPAMGINKITNETSSENDNTKVPEKPQLDSSPAMEINKPTNETNSENDTKEPLAMEIDEIANKASSENDSKATIDSVSMETEELPKATSSENDSKATGETQQSSGLAIETAITNKQVADELPIATNEVNSEKDTIAIGEYQPDAGSATKTSDENATMEKAGIVTNETTVINKQTNGNDLEKDTKVVEKVKLKAEMNNALSNREEEPFVNDKESHEVKNNSENEKIVNNIPKDITTDSNTDVQALKDDNNSKDSSQNNNV